MSRSLDSINLSFFTTRETLRVARAFGRYRDDLNANLVSISVVRQVDWIDLFPE